MAKFAQGNQVSRLGGLALQERNRQLAARAKLAQNYEAALRRVLAMTHTASDPSAALAEIERYVTQILDAHETL